MVILDSFLKCTLPLRVLSSFWGPLQRLAQSYTPYGEVLATEGEATTSYAFTGEALDAYTGLIYLRARWYGPAWGWFVSRDVWKGDYRAPGTLNRWVYALSNPVRFVDPSGKRPWCPPGQEDFCVIEGYDITFDSHSDVRWDGDDQDAVMEGVVMVASSMTRIVKTIGFSRPRDQVFNQVFGPLVFYLSNSSGELCERDAGRGGVTCPNGATGTITGHWMAHELGHVFNATVANKRNRGEIPADTQTPYDTLKEKGVYAVIPDEDGPCAFTYEKIAGWVSGEGYRRTNFGYRPRTQHNTEAYEGEDFADMFANWAYNSFAEDTYGIARKT